MSSIHAGYMSEALIDVKKHIANALRAIHKSDVVFTHVAVQGVSGLTFGSILAYRLDLPLIVVRKETRGQEMSHSEYRVEGLPLYRTTPIRLLFVDDFVASGSTFARIMRTIIAHCYTDVKCMGGYMYHLGYGEPKFKTGFNWRKYLQGRCMANIVSANELNKWLG